MSTSQKLLALAERLESAERPLRALDMDIHLELILSQGFKGLEPRRYRGTYIPGEPGLADVERFLVCHYHPDPWVIPEDSVPNYTKDFDECRDEARWLAKGCLASVSLTPDSASVTFKFDAGDEKTGRARTVELAWWAALCRVAAERSPTAPRLSASEALKAAMITVCHPEDAETDANRVEGLLYSSGYEIALRKDLEEASRS